MPSPNVGSQVVLASRGATLALVALALFWFSTGSSAGGQASKCPSTESGGERLGGIPGPEDLELQLTGPGAPRLLASSQFGRGFSSAPGEIYSLPLPLPLSGPERGGVPVLLRLTGRDGCSFHPHGLALAYPGEGKPRLYVINHHEDKDRSGCPEVAEGFKSAPRRAEVNSIEIFEPIDSSTWGYVGRLLEPELLTHPNDLAALPDGRLYVTNAPGSDLANLWEGLIGNATSSVVTYDPEEERWHRVALRPRVANGIAVDPTRNRLYVAETAGKTIDVLALDRSGGANAPQKVGEISIESGLDNLSWGPAGPEGRTLWVAAHPSLWAFTKHGSAWSKDKPKKPFSPSEVYRVQLRENGAKVECLYRDSGERISAGSTALPFGDSLYVGQVFGDFVLRLPLPAETSKESP